MISDKLILELQAIIKDEYGRDLSFDEVAKIGNDLVVIFDTLAKINFRVKHHKG
jgi:hypothetical protein